MRDFLRFFAVFLAFLIGAPAMADDRPIIAVYDLSDPAGTGQAAAFSEMIRSAVSSSSKFRVMERSEAGERTLSKESGRARSGQVTSNNPKKKGGYEGADYLIYGTITTLNARQKADLLGTIGVGVLGGNAACSKMGATLQSDISITDNNTGEVLYSASVHRVEKSGSTCLGDGSIDFSVLLRGAANEVVGKLVLAVYPMKVAAVQADGTVLINYGEGFLNKKQKYSIFIKGKEVLDPDTGRPLSSEETVIAIIEITDVQGGFSKSRILKSTGEEIPIGSIVREATKDDESQFKGKKRK